MHIFNCNNCNTVTTVTTAFANLAISRCQVANPAVLNALVLKCIAKVRREGIMILIRRTNLLA